MLVVSFAVVLTLSAIIGRLAVINYRSKTPIQRPLNAANAGLDVVAAIAGLSFWANLVWGFSSLSWYVVLGITLVASFLGGILPNPPRLVFFYRIERLLELSIVALTAWLWVWNWPY